MFTCVAAGIHKNSKTNMKGDFIIFLQLKKVNSISNIRNIQGNYIYNDDIQLSAGINA